MENNISAVQQTIRAITWSKQKRPIHSQMLAILVCSVFTIIDIATGYQFLMFPIGNINFTLAHFLPMILFGVMGYLDGMVFLIIQFFAFGLFHFEQSYLSFISMLMCAAIYFVSRARWLLSWKKNCYISVVNGFDVWVLVAYRVFSYESRTGNSDIGRATLLFRCSDSGVISCTCYIQTYSHEIR